MGAKCAAGEAALPSIVQMLASKEGIRGFVEFYTGAPLQPTRARRVSTVSEWKEYLAAAGSRPVVALFTSSADLTCRIFGPAFARLAGPPVGAASSTCGEGGTDGEDGDGGEGSEQSARAEEFANVEFLHVAHDASKDDGLAMQVFDEAYVSPRSLPTVLFLDECLERRKWRYAGADAGEVARRLRRIIGAESEAELEDGPGGDEIV